MYKYMLALWNYIYFIFLLYTYVFYMYSIDPLNERSP